MLNCMTDCTTAEAEAAAVAAKKPCSLHSSQLCQTKLYYVMDNNICCILFNLRIFLYIIKLSTNDLDRMWVCHMCLVLFCVFIAKFILNINLTHKNWSP